jgi:hypothetical protein
LPEPAPQRRHIQDRILEHRCLQCSKAHFSRQISWVLRIHSLIDPMAAATSSDVLAEAEHALTEDIIVTPGDEICRAAGFVR